MLVDFGDYSVDELSPKPSFDQPSQHHKNSLATEEKAKFHQFNPRHHVLFGAPPGMKPREF
jgi:hypothetical protein